MTQTKETLGQGLAISQGFLDASYWTKITQPYHNANEYFDW